MTTGVNGTEYIEIASVTDSSGRVHGLISPINISISKAPVYVRYSTIYVGDVNSQPKERVTTTSMLNCATNPTSASPSGACSPLMYNGGQVQYSGGFCCTCSLDQMVGLGSHQRGDVQCNLLSGLFGTGASVHCLRWGDVWYSIFRLMTPSIESTVRITVGDDLIDLNNQNAVSSLSVNQTLNLTARLVGSFNWIRSPTDWGLNMYAVAPNIPASKPGADARFTGWTPTNPFKHGHLLPQTAFDLSGKTCNRIGVSHYAFVNDQGSRCSGSVGDCTGNQIEDIWLASKPSDFIPAKLCQSIGGAFVDNDNYRLSCRLDDSSSDVPTQVMIELNAVGVSIVLNEGLGSILNITTSVDVQALTQTAIVSIKISNTGVLNSEFIASVDACNPDTLTLPLSGTRFSLSPKQETSIDIKIEDSVMDGFEYACRGVLTDSEGIMLDSRWFNLTISAVSVDKGSQSDEGSSNDGAVNVDSKGNLDPCSTTCGGFFSLICFVTHTCWGRLGALLGTVGGVSLGLFAFFKLGGLSLISKLCGGIGSCCCKRRSEATSEKRRQSYPEIPHIQHQYEYFPNTGYISRAQFIQYPN